MNDIIAVFLVALYSIGLCGTIGYFIGKRAGFQAGREHELDRAAQRHIQQKRHRI